MRWPWRLHREWGKRVAQARAEAEQSRTDLKLTREQVVVPLSEWRKHNHFSDILRASLREGRDEHLCHSSSGPSWRSGSF